MDMKSVLDRASVLVRSHIGEVVEAARFVGGVALLWLGLTTFAFATYYIPSESMQPTLEVGDRIYVSKWAYGYSRHSLPMGAGDILPDSWDGRVGWAQPRRGDIVVVRDTRQGLNLIKRVVGLPGDLIEVRSGRLVINDQIVDRDYVDTRRYREHGPRAAVVAVAHYQESLPDDQRPHAIYERSDDYPSDDFGPVLVPAGRVFLMGDNRDNSRDSRAAGGPGFVRLSHIVGRAETVPFTFERCRREEGLYCPRGRVWRGL